MDLMATTLGLSFQRARDPGMWASPSLNPSSGLAVAVQPKVGHQAGFVFVVASLRLMPAFAPLHLEPDKILLRYQ